MRILHTSDWHLGKYLNSYSRIEEQRVVLDEICNLCEQNSVDVVLLAGDLYDNTNPSIEAQELLYKVLKRLANNGKRPVVAIAGNHDSPERIDSPEPLARECGIIFNGNPISKINEFELPDSFKTLNSQEGYFELVLKKFSYPLRIISVPYANEYRMRTYLNNEDKETALREILEQKWMQLSNLNFDNKGVNIMIAHLFVVKDGEKIPDENLDEMKPINIGGAQIIYTSNLPKNLNYVALGHLHRKQIIDHKPCPVVYSGSPLAYSFAEDEQKKYVLLIDLEPNKEPIITPIELKTPKTLIRKSFVDIEHAKLWLDENKENNVLIELTIITKSYLNSETQKEFYQINRNIVELKILKEADIQSDEKKEFSNKIQKMTIEDMFAEYFVKQKSIEPDENIMNLFKEIVSQEDKENEI